MCVCVWGGGGGGGVGAYACVGVCVSVCMHVRETDFQSIHNSILAYTLTVPHTATVCTTIVHSSIYSKTSEQKTHWGRASCPL